MASNVELENLVVRLSADVEGLLRGMEQTKTAVNSAAVPVQNMTESLRMMAGVMAGLGAKRFLQSSLHEWEQAETALIKLEAVLEANGRSVLVVSKDYQEFASAMQEVTTTGDDAVIMMLKQAESFNLTGQAAKDATKDAMALAAINDSSAQAMMRITAAMTEGDTEKAMMMGRLVPQLRGIKDEAEFTEKYLKLVAAGTEVMNKEAQTGTGRMKQYANAWGDFKEQIGKIASEAIAPVAIELTDMAKKFQELDQETKEWIVGMAAATAALVILANVLPTVAAGIRTMTIATVAFSKAAFALPANPFFWAGAAAIGIAMLTAELVRSTDAYERFEKAKSRIKSAGDWRETVRNTDLQDLIESGDRDAIQKALDRYQNLSKEHDKMLEENQALLNKAYQEVGSTYQTMSPVPFDIAPETTGRIVSQVAGVAGIEAPGVGTAKASLEDTKRFIAGNKDAIQQLTSALDKLDRPAQRATDVFNDLNRVLDKQAEEFGKNEIQIKMMGVQANMTIDQIEELIQKMADQETRKKRTESLTSLESMIKQSEMEMAALEAKRKGDTFYNKELEHLAKSLEENNPLLGIARDMDRKQRILQEVTDLEEKFMKPEERFAREQDRLYEVLVEGAGRWDLYSQAVADAASNLHEAAAAARDVAAVGSAEGFARIWEFSTGTGASPFTQRMPRKMQRQADKEPKADWWEERNGEWVPMFEDKSQKIVDVLSRIEGHLKNKQTFEVLPANLDEVT